LLTYQAIGRECHGFRQGFQREETGVFGIGTGLEDSRGVICPEPYTNGLLLAIMEIGVGREDGTEFNVEAGLLLEFANRRCPDVLIPLHVATGDAPHIPIGSGSLNQQQLAFLHQDNGDTDGGIAIVYRVTATAVGAILTPVVLFL